jgi:transcriptional regulator with XRE-family HTH domain
MRNQTQKSGAQQLFATNMRRIRHENYVSSVERGERNISICNIARIAFALGVGMEALVTATPTENT